MMKASYVREPGNECKYKQQNLCWGGEGGGGGGGGGGGSPYERFAERLAHVDAAQIDVYADIKRSKPRSFRETIL